MNELLKNLMKKLLDLENDKNQDKISERIIELLEKRLNLSSLKIFTFNFDLVSKINLISNEFLNFGISKRSIRESELFVEISSTKNLFPFILLREIYIYGFIPEDLRKNTTIQAIIYKIIINDLKELEGQTEFDKIARKFFIESSFLDESLDRIGQFIKTKEEKRYIFRFLRDNYNFLKNVDERIYIKLFYEKNFLQYDSLIPDDDLIESIRILIEIFYKTEKYDSIKNYKNIFNKMRKNNRFLRDLSLRNFSKMVSYLKTYHYLAPSYQLNWSKLNVKPIIDTYKFSRNLNVSKKREIKKLPFSLSGKESRNCFNFVLSSYIVIPERYQYDFIGLMYKLDRSKIFIEKHLMFIEEIITNFLNLNYFREFNYPRKQIINPKIADYDPIYEIDFNIAYSKNGDQIGLTPLEFLVLDRIRYISITGFGFERKRKLLSMLKSDLLSLVILKQKNVNKLEKNVEKFYNNQQLTKNFSQILKLNKEKSFFTILEFLSDLKKFLHSINIEVSKKDYSLNQISLTEFLKSEDFLKTIETKKIFSNRNLKNHFYKHYFQIIIESKEKFEKEINQIEAFHKLLLAFKEINIYDINKILDILRNKSLLKEIISNDKKKLKPLSHTFRELSIDTIKNTLDKFLSEGFIKPCLINTIFTSTFTNYFPQLILKDDKDTREVLNRIKKFFPRVLILKIFEPLIEENFLLVEFYIPPLANKEKKLLLSIIYNLLTDKIIEFRRFFHSGILETFSLVENYDFSSKKFEYNRHLFEEYYQFLKDKTGRFSITRSKQINWRDFKSFLLKENDIYKLVKTVKNRVIKESIEFDPKKFNELETFSNKLIRILKNKKDFTDIKTKEFFKRYVDSVLFIPIYQNFGLSQYFLYIYPENLDEIDYKLLFLNTFQEIKYPAELASSIPLFIKYVFPHRTPNNAYLNWLVKSKKSIREYALFYIQKIYFILNFNYNLQPYGWYVDYKKFKTYLDNILVNKDYQIDISTIKSCNVGNLNTSNYRGPTSEDYKNLLRIHNTKPTNIKSLTSFIYKKEFHSLQSLLKKGLIHPFLKLKNLDFKEVIYIIVPDIKKEDLNKIVEIFNFFNYCFIYEIEGEYFIQGNLEEKTYENGVMVELYLPGNTQIGELFKLFDLMFSVMNLENYIIMHDLVDGESLIKNTFNRIDLSEYNPLKNLKWNDIDKKWMNPKIYDEIFNPIYPDLVKED